MVDVFISYSRENAAKAGLIAESVKALGYSVWWDAELPPHRSYGDVITEQISSAKAAIVVWSRSAAESEWVRAEADVARGQKKLIQTSIDESMPPMPFNQIQFASIGDWAGEDDHPGWRKVKLSLDALCGPASAAPVEAPRVAERPPRQPAETTGAGEPRIRRSTTMPILIALVVALAAGLAFLLGRGGGTPAPSLANAPMPAPTPEPAREAASAGPRAAPRAAPEPALEPAPQPAREAALPEPAEAWDGSVQEIVPASGSRRLAEQDLAGLSRAQLRLARNEIYARHGRRFHDPALAAHFSRFSWYSPRSDDVRLSGVEQENVRLISKLEAQR